MSCRGTAVEWCNPQRQRHVHVRISKRLATSREARARGALKLGLESRVLKMLPDACRTMTKATTAGSEARPLCTNQQHPALKLEGRYTAQTAKRPQPALKLERHETAHMPIGYGQLRSLTTKLAVACLNQANLAAALASSETLRRSASRWLNSLTQASAPNRASAWPFRRQAPSSFLFRQNMFRTEREWCPEVRLR